MAKNKYNNYSKEQLIEKIKLLERQRYGLVWEDKPEAIADQCERELPVLKEDKSKEIINDPAKPTNFIFEGDNYHTLYTLNFTHKRKIDVIYIDPPYNTGNKSWKYNNNYIEKDDPYKHSYFISFLNKRLRLARNLLKNSGLIFIAIDDYEIHNVRHIADKIFGEENRLGTCVILHNPGGRQDDKFFPTAHEYMLVYSKNKNEAKINTLDISQDKISQFKLEDNFGKYKLRGFRRSGNNSRKEDGEGLYYSVFYNESTNEISLEKQKGFIEILPVDDNGIQRCWRWAPGTFLEKKEKYIEIKKTKHGNFDIYVKERETDHLGEKAKTMWLKPKYSAVNGTSSLKKIFQKFDEKIFNYPKSPYLLLDVLKISTNKKSIVLDFFAGSGTTGQAVLELNAEDNGERQFILCTNNENKICEEVTYPRIKKVIEDYGANKGIKANLKYFKTDYVPFVLTDNDKRTLVARSTELLCIAENTFEVIKQNKKKLDFSIFKNAKQLTAIIYDEDSIENCCSELNKINPKHKVIIYVFSYDHTYDEVDFETLKIKFDVKPIPEAILNVYRKISKLKRK